MQLSCTVKQSIVLKIVYAASQFNEQQCSKAYSDYDLDIKKKQN